MEKLIHILEPLTPIIIVLSLALFMTLESFLPYMQHSAFRKQQKWHNLANILLSFVLNALLSGLITTAIMNAEATKFGLLPTISPPFWISLVVGILFCDFNAYVAHRLYHSVPLFWRFHRVHHSDTELDATSALRLHPFEFLFQAFSQATVLPLLGVSLASFVIYFTIALPLFVINHTNIKFPLWYEKIVGLVFITPNRHRVHHSSYQPETDSNFGDVFSIWDRLLGTYKKADVEKLEYGLEDLRERNDQTFVGQMKTPFKKIQH